MARRHALSDSRGGLVARALTGAWRRTPPALNLTAHEIPAAARLYLESGTGPLGWWRVRDSAFRQEPSVADLRNAYRLSSVWAVFHQQVIADLVSRFRAGGVEPILVKGWAAARLYPEPGLRAYTDHDVCVRREDRARAHAVLAARAVSCTVDLHVGFATLDEGDEDDLFDRSILEDCGGTPVRVLAPEDHLRVLCRHFLRHGAARPMWLCDVAAAVEARAPAFDWTRAFGSRRRATTWVPSTLALAHELLGMSLDGTPLDGHPPRLPGWLVPTVLREWSSHHCPLPLVADSLRRPTRILAELRRHWPNGLQATVAVRGPINRVPRLAFQAAACIPGAMRIGRDLVRLRVARAQDAARH